MRKCAICEEMKAESEFYKSSRSNKLGVPYTSSYCKACSKHRSKLSYHTKSLPGAKPEGWMGYELRNTRISQALYNRLAKKENLDINDWSEMLQVMVQLIDPDLPDDWHVGDMPTAPRPTAEVPSAEVPPTATEAPAPKNYEEELRKLFDE